MRSIALILPVLVFVGRVALASPIVVGRDNLVVCTYTTAQGTGTITQKDISAFLAGEKTNIPKAALADCCSKTQADSSGGSLTADDHRQHLDETTPPPCPSSMKDGARVGKSSNDDVQLDESTNNKPSGLSSPSPLRSSSNSQNANIKADDKMEPSKTEDVDGEVDPSLPSSNSQNANIKADDKTKPSETGDVDGELDPSKSSFPSYSNSPNADVKAGDKTKPSDEDVDGEVDPSNNSQKADIKADDKTNPSDEDIEGDADILDEASKLAEEVNRAQAKGKAANKAPGDSDRARVGMEDCPCRKA